MATLLDFVNSAAPSFISIKAGGPGSGRKKQVFSSYSHVVEMVPTVEVKRFMEFDRTKYPGSDNRINELSESIRKEGVKEPLIIQYSLSSKKALLTEGNHRLAAAMREGIEELPVRVIRRWSEFESKDKGVLVSGYKGEGHIPEDLKPSMIGIKVNASIKAGGAGSGCRGSNCGRPRKKDESRQQRAISSYKPMTKNKIKLALANQTKLAKLLGGTEIGDHKPFDVIIKGKRIGIEVKTIFAGAKANITMHKASLARKVSFAKKAKLSSYTVVFDNRSSNSKYFWAQGLGSFKLPELIKTPGAGALKKSSFDGLRKVIK